jgi:microsomal dipeptidase-like Zn-dependent dipeptidase
MHFDEVYLKLYGMAKAGFPNGNPADLPVWANFGVAGLDMRPALTCLIGVILDPYLLSNYATGQLAEDEGSLRDVVRTIRYLAKLIGHEHVAIGSDFAGFVGPPREMNRISRIGQLREALRVEFGDEKIVTGILAQNSIDFILKTWQPAV